MRKDIAGPETESTMPMWEGLEGVVREKAQEFIQQIMEEEAPRSVVSNWWCERSSSDRAGCCEGFPGYRPSAWNQGAVGVTITRCLRMQAVTGRLSEACHDKL